MIFKKNKYKSKTDRNPSGKLLNDQKVISYYSASRRQLDSFERNAGLVSNKSLKNSLTKFSKWWFWPIIVIIVIVSLCYLLSLSSEPIINIKGQSYRTNDQYKTIIEPEFKNNYIYRIKPLLKKENIKESLLLKLPEAENISVSTSIIGHRPIVNITTTKTLAIFNQSDNVNLLISERGKMLLPVIESTIDTNKLPLLQNLSNIEAKAGEQFMHPDEAKAFKSLISQFNIDNSITTYNLTVVPRELIVSETGRGYQVKFLLNDQIVLQYGAMRATQNKLTQIGQTPIEYMDVRLADKVYYK